MKTDDVNQIIVNTFEKPILEVEEAFKELTKDLDTEWSWFKKYNAKKISNMQSKINALKELVPTVQD